MLRDEFQGHRRRDHRDDDIPALLIAIILLLILVVGIFAWSWMTRGTRASSDVATQEQTKVVSEPLSEIPPEREPEPFIEPDPKPIPEQDIPPPEEIESAAIEEAPLAVAVLPPPEPIDLTVYFELMSPDLTDEAEELIKGAISAGDVPSIAKVRIAGFTDTAGTRAYNLPLSKKRAESVAGALGDFGIPRSTLEIDWYGETRLATPTEDGVREPLNRRASVRIEFE
ncbi:MAG: OmpA family protein [Pseudomonadota bacterium]